MVSTQQTESGPRESGPGEYKVSLLRLRIEIGPPPPKTAAHIIFRRREKARCVQSSLSRRERVTDEVRGARENKHDDE